MAIWLGKKNSPLIPLYCPAKFQNEVNDKSILHESTIRNIRLYCIEEINHCYQELFEKNKKNNKYWRLLRKLFRDPRQFWLDSKIFNMLDTRLYK